MSDERIYPPGTVPAFAAVLGLLVGLAFLCALAITRCSPESTQMVPRAPAAVTQTAIATASAQIIATQSVRVTVRRMPTAFQPPALQDAPEGPLPARQVSQDPARQAVEGDRGDEIVVEVSQELAAVSASSASTQNDIQNAAATGVIRIEPTHGHLGVALMTMPGILAADLQLVCLDVSPVTRPLVDVDMEVGLDAAGNLDAGALGVSAGGKAFAVGGAWSRWNLSQQGYFLGLGLRF